MKQQVMYLDREELGNLSPVLPSEISVIYAGKRIQPSYPGCEVTALDRIFSEQYDYHLCFHKDLPQFSFYPVPELFIFAIDSYGGSFVSTNLAAKNPDAKRADIYYLDRHLKAHWLAPDMQSFLSLMIFHPDFKQALACGEFSIPEPSDKAKTFLINTYALTPPAPFAKAPELEIRMFHSLAMAKESLPFLGIDELTNTGV